MRLARVLTALGFAVSLNAATVIALAGDEQTFIELFAGSWSGSGTIIKGSIPLQVSCRATGQPGTDQITIEGTCSLFVVSVRIAADITYDPSAEAYSGTYIGAKVGPARVLGKRDGSVVNLAITWPRPVHGDTEARMTIENTGDGSLRLSIFDNVVPGGDEEQTTDVILSRM